MRVLKGLGFPEIGGNPFGGVPIKRTIVCWGLLLMETAR